MNKQRASTSEYGGVAAGQGVLDLDGRSNVQRPIQNLTGREILKAQNTGFAVLQDDSPVWDSLFLRLCQGECEPLSYVRAWPLFPAATHSPKTEFQIDQNCQVQCLSIHERSGVLRTACLAASPIRPGERH